MRKQQFNRKNSPVYKLQFVIAHKFLNTKNTTVEHQYTITYSSHKPDKSWP